MKKLLFTAVFAYVVAVPSFATYIIDDGTAEETIGKGLATPNSFLWGNAFTVEAGCETITSVIGSFCSPLFPEPVLNGRSVTAFVLRTSNLNTPITGGLLASVTGVISDQATDTFITFDTPDVTLAVGDKFMVGFVHNTVAGEVRMHPGGLDESDPDFDHRSYIAFTGPGQSQVDPNNVNAVPSNQRQFIEFFGFPGNWTVRAGCQAVPEPSAGVALAVIMLGWLSTRRRG
jgi:uncharacterized protein (TIGR03382 family)